MKRNEQLKTALGENVARLREEQELTKKSFAIMSGVSRPYLDSVEKGTSDARLSYVQKFADALCVEPGDLLQDHSTNSSSGSR